MSDWGRAAFERLGYSENKHDGEGRTREAEGEAQDEHGLFSYRPRRGAAVAYYYPSMTTVYSLVSEPSLAFLWTHGCTFYVRPFPSGYLTTPTQPLAARPGTSSRRCEPVQPG